MSVTIGQWVLVAIVVFTGLCLTIAVGVNCKSKITTIAVAVIAVIVTAGCLGAFNWYNTSTASGARHYKDYESNMSNGIEREVVITAEDGREIFRYEGKIDLEMDNEGNYLRFETQDGKRYTIEYGVQDTVIAIEK